MNQPGIRRIEQIDAAEELAAVIREAFGTVAAQFHITRENCPSNAAFLTGEEVRASQARGAAFWGVYDGETLVGCFALEQGKEEGVQYLERLAVLPGHRHKGYGAALLNKAADLSRQLGARKLSIGIIEENRVLKEWYCRHGFAVTEIKRFESLPFTVCFLELPL